MQETQSVLDERSDRKLLSRPVTLSSLLQGRNNNFGLIRHLAAFLVLVGHSYIFQPDRGRIDIFRILTKVEYSGSLAVFAFFFLSGILVTQSWDRQNSIGKFAALRVARIWPGLAACMFVLTYVGAPIFSGMAYGEFISQRMTLDFFAHNISLLAGVRYDLPGVFSNNATHAVNGSLWTLPVEIGCYGIVAILGLLGFSSGRVKALIGALLVMFAWYSIFFMGHVGSAIHGFIFKPTDFTAYPLPFFMVGYVAYNFRNSLIIRWEFALILVVAYVVCKNSFFGNFLLYLFLVYIILYIASIKSLRRFEPNWDISYGIYIYGFFIQQCVAAIFPHQDNLVGLAISTVFTVMFAAASWWLVERHAINFVRGVLGKRNKVPHPAPESER